MWSILFSNFTLIYDFRYYSCTNHNIHSTSTISSWPESEFLNVTNLVRDGLRVTLQFHLLSHDDVVQCIQLEHQMAILICLQDIRDGHPISTRLLHHVQATNQLMMTIKSSTYDIHKEYSQSMMSTKRIVSLVWKS